MVSVDMQQSIEKQQSQKLFGLSLSSNLDSLDDLSDLEKKIRATRTERYACQSVARKALPKGFWCKYLGKI
ncbi:hypothetical protein [Bacillus cereus]|uniref:Uncharacterized protein n=1 Tax=Bacillus cereus TaxID=1396 RepID=A0A2A7HPM1_BACCE|nr:hypothetical protein [Bacillus cereus]PEC18982.1 hypothetical protein COM96_27565 [Bacillus cereus]